MEDGYAGALVVEKPDGAVRLFRYEVS